MTFESGHQTVRSMRLSAFRIPALILSAFGKRGPATGSHQLDTKGNWVVELSKSCRVQKLLAKLGPLLATLHTAGCLHVDMESTEERALFGTTEELGELGVTHVHCDDPDGNGRVYFSMAQPGGMVDPTGADLADWVTKFLAREVCGRTLQAENLRCSNTPRSHCPYSKWRLDWPALAPLFR